MDDFQTSTDSNTRGLRLKDGLRNTTAVVRAHAKGVILSEISKVRL